MNTKNPILSKDIFSNLSLTFPPFCNSVQNNNPFLTIHPQEQKGIERAKKVLVCIYDIRVVI